MKHPYNGMLHSCEKERTGFICRYGTVPRNSGNNQVHTYMWVGSVHIKYIHIYVCVMYTNICKIVSNVPLGV